MTERCFDEGTIQAFLDGELESDLLETVARHTAACPSCAMLLQEAENESAFAFSALGEEFNSLVPTERIRTNLYDAIAQLERPRKSLWVRVFGASFSFSTPSLVAFASLLLVFGLFATLYIRRETQNAGGNEIAKIQPAKSSQSPTKAETGVVEPVISGEKGSINVGGNDGQNGASTERKPVYRPTAGNQPRFEKANFRLETPSSNAQRTKTGVRPETDNGQRTTNETLLGEESYVKTIATLTDNVNSRKDSALRPSERVAFEKDLAVVDDAIRKMQKEVRRNPKNEAAKQVLRSSYQNKIDLLNSVAEKTELMALK